MHAKYTRQTAKNAGPNSTPSSCGFGESLGNFKQSTAKIAEFALYALFDTSSHEISSKCNTNKKFPLHLNLLEAACSSLS